MAEPPDSPYVLTRWYRVAGETQDLLRRTEELMEQRAELCRRSADLFRELLITARHFVHEAATTDSRQEDPAATGTVESSRSR